MIFFVPIIRKIVLNYFPFKVSNLLFSTVSTVSLINWLTKRCFPVNLSFHFMFSSTQTWRDYNLVWEPAKYDNIEELPVISYQIWTPDIGVYSS